MELVEMNLGALVAAVAVMVGVAQAVIGMMAKFGLKGYTMLISSAVAMLALVFAVRYGWAYEPVRLALGAILAVLTAAGYWRYRNGEPTESLGA